MSAIAAGWLLLVAAAGLAFACGGARAPTVLAAPKGTAASRPAGAQVAALGRIQPERVVRVAGPARVSVVVGKLLVDVGDTVSAGHVVALLDAAGTEEAQVQELNAQLAS